MNYMKHSTEQMLKEVGLKVTPMRVTLLELFVGSKIPLTAKDILVSLKQKKVPVDTVTLYRTLNSFEETGLIKSIHLGKDALSYEIVDSGHHHHHIICTKCDALEDIDMCVFDTVEASLLKKSKLFKLITKHSFELFGICNNCSKTK